MNLKRMPWERPPQSGIPNRPGDNSPESIYCALGRSLSAWEGVNAALDSLFYSLQSRINPGEIENSIKTFATVHKTHDRAKSIREAADEFLMGDFGEERAKAAKIRKKLKSTLARYVGWVARRNDLAHGYVTEAQGPDYTLDEQPIVTSYALLPSHARPDRWYNSEPDWNYLALEIFEFAQHFSHLDDTLEGLAVTVAELGEFRTQTNG